MTRHRPAAVAALAAIVVATAAAAAAVAATNNPLDAFNATDTDSRSPGIGTELSSEKMRTLTNIRDGDRAVYKAFDFDSGVASFRMRYASVGGGTVDVRLDGPAGPLLGTCAFADTGGWDRWADAECKVDHSQATVRDIYLAFHGTPGRPLLELSRFVFLKSVVGLTSGPAVDLAARVDAVDDEPQATRAWGVPEAGFRDGFEDGRASHWTVRDLAVVADAGGHHLAHAGGGTGVAYLPGVYINKTDTGGEWRTLAEASLTATVRVDDAGGRAGIGFTSTDGTRSVYVALNPAADTLEAYRQLRGGPAVLIASHPHPSTDPDRQARAAADAVPRHWHVRPGVDYQLQVDWSPYSDGLIAFLRDAQGTVLTSFRTVIDLPAARRPMLIAWGGRARFGGVAFDPTLDGWNYRWEWRKTPVLSPDVCNPAVWTDRDGTFHMMWRQFGGDTYHGVASSADGIAWKRLDDRTIKVRGDMNCVVDPFGDGLLYVTPGGNKLPWWTSDGSKNYTVWQRSDKTVGDIHGNSRIQEIIDTRRYPQLAPIQLGGMAYRFVAFTEDWGRPPKPHTVVMLSNTLTDWTVADDGKPLLPPAGDFWGEKGSAVGAAIPLPDGNILVSACACTNAGYTGSPEPSNVSVIVDGKRPWHVLRVATLPDAPVSREPVWYEGPNFGTALVYDSKADTLFYYGGFHDYRIGVMRVRHFAQGPR